MYLEIVVEQPRNVILPGVGEPTEFNEREVRAATRILASTFLKRNYTLKSDIIEGKLVVEAKGAARFIPDNEREVVDEVDGLLYDRLANADIYFGYNGPHSGEYHGFAEAGNVLVSMYYDG